MRITFTLLLILIALIGAALLASVWHGGQNQMPQTRIAVSETPLSAPLIIAGNNGYFQKHGVNVVLQKARGGVKCMAMLLNDEVDLATVSDSVVMFSRLERDDFGVLVSFAESDNDVKIMAMSNETPPLINELETGQAGVVANSASEFFLDAYLTMEGLNVAGVEKKGFEPNKLGEALVNGEVDYISVWEPYSYMLSRDYPGEVYTFDTRGVNNLHFVLSHKTDAQGNSTISRETSEGIIAALAEANRFISQSPKHAKTIVGEFLNLPEAQLAYLWPDYTFRLSLSDAMLLSLTMQASWAISAGKTTQRETPEFRDLFVHSPLLPASYQQNSAQ